MSGTAGFTLIWVLTRWAGPVLLELRCRATTLATLVSPLAAAKYAVCGRGSGEIIEVLHGLVTLVFRLIHLAYHSMFVIFHVIT
jgi:hypothetical protein